MKHTILAFHIGRGGRFHNQGYLSFIGKRKISEFTGDLFLNYENQSDYKDRLGYLKSFDDVPCILDCMTERDTSTLLEKYGISESDLGDYIYTNCSGSPVGLTYDEAETGIGTIDLDGDYDTTYTTYLKDLTHDELLAIEREAGTSDILLAFAELTYNIKKEREGFFVIENGLRGTELYRSENFESRDEAEEHAINLIIHS